MKLTIGIENVNKYFYKILAEELSEYGPIEVFREGDDVVVRTEGDIVKCSCVVAICDKYRNSGKIGLGDDV